MAIGTNKKLVVTSHEIEASEKFCAMQQKMESAKLGTGNLSGIVTLFN